MSDTAGLPKGSPVTAIEEKFVNWLQVQPEWLAIVAMDRPARRAAVKELASRLYTIASMDAVNTVPRQVRRKAAKQVAAVAKDQARKEVLNAVQMRTNQLLIESARALQAQQAAAQMDEQELEQALADLTEGQEISEEALAAAAADRALMAEAEASVALDGETQSVGPAGETYGNPDPEGEVKADIEAGKEASDEAAADS